MQLACRLVRGLGLAGQLGTVPLSPEGLPCQASSQTGSPRAPTPPARASLNHVLVSVCLFHVLCPTSQRKSERNLGEVQQRNHTGLMRPAEIYQVGNLIFTNKETKTFRL